MVLNGKKSIWIQVLLLIWGSPKGPILKLLVFAIYTNNIDSCVTSKLLKFGDDTKLIQEIESYEGIEQITQDLRNLCNWSREWLMIFNIEN